MDESMRKKQWLAQPDAEAAARKRAPEPSGEPAPAANQTTAAVLPLRKTRKAKPPAGLRKEPAPANIEGHIGRQLKAVYDDVLKQPIPDRFLDLLSQLEEKTGGKARDAGDEGGET